jgi:hypothetical protein
MRYSIFILLVGLDFALCGQSNSELRRRLLLLEDRSAFLFDTTGISLFSAIPNPCDDTIHWNSYHVMDLNSDGLKDLIYSGPSNPYVETNIYMNTGNGLKFVFQSAGQVVSVQNNLTFSTINILKEACCCDKYSDQLELKIDNHNNIAQNTISFHSDTKIFIDDSLETFVFKGIIRTNPTLDDIRRTDECSDLVYEGNKLISTKKKAEVVQLSNNEDWSLILFKENNQRYWIGWIETKE